VSVNTLDRDSSVYAAEYGNLTTVPADQYSRTSTWRRCTVQPQLHPAKVLVE